MHVPDSADIGGGGLYTIGPPRSVIGRHILNALVQEVLGVLSFVGISPRASGTVDAAASYTGQLRDAIMRAAWSAASTAHQMTSSSGPSLAPSRDVHAYHITENGGGPYANGTIGITNNANDRGRFLFIRNASGTYKQVILNSSRAVLAPGQGTWLYCYDDGATGIWIKADGRNDRYHFTYELYVQAQGASDVSSAFTVEYHFDNPSKNSRLTFPASASITLTNSPNGYLFLVQTDNNPLPDIFLPDVDGRSMPIIIDNNSLGTREIGSLRFVAGSPNQWRIYRAEDADFDVSGGSTWRVYFPELQFRSRQS